MFENITGMIEGQHGGARWPYYDKPYRIVWFSDKKLMLGKLKTLFK